MADEQQQQPVPDWVSDPSNFDPARAWQTVQNLRRSVADKLAAVESRLGIEPADPDDLDARHGAVSEALAAAERAPQQRLDELRRRSADLERQIKEQQDATRDLRIRIDAQNRGVPQADDVPVFIDKGLWAVDSNAAFADLMQRKPYLFRPAPTGARRIWPGA